MYQKILAHKKFMEEKLVDDISDKDKRYLFKYHQARVRDFQHERLIHLLVTFFFSMLLIGSAVAWLLVPLNDLFWPLALLSVLLLGLVLAYIRHYYQLENGVQSLYDISIKFK